MGKSKNEWGVSSNAIAFFEQVLSSHTAVASYNRVNNIQFIIQRHNDLPDVNVILLEEYMLGEAKVYAVLNVFKNVTAVVNNGNWNHIAFNWREFAKNTGVSVLKLSDFMGALNVKQLDQYTPREEREERHRKHKKSS